MAEMYQIYLSGICSLQDIFEMKYYFRSNNRPTLNASLAGLVESTSFLEYVDAVLLGTESQHRVDQWSAQYLILSMPSV
jgi:hypothetical protein